MATKYYYIIGGIIIAILIALYIGKSIGEKDQRDTQIKTEIKVVQVESEKAKAKIDSLNNVLNTLSEKDKDYKKEEIKTKQKADDIVITKPSNPECNDLYEKATTKIVLLEKTIVIKDSIESNLRTQIRLKDNIIFEKDKIIDNKDKEIALLKDLGKPRDKKWSVSLQLGTGGGITQTDKSIQIKQVPIYVGVGLSRHIFSF